MSDDWTNRHINMNHSYHVYMGQELINVKVTRKGSKLLIVTCDWLGYSEPVQTVYEASRAITDSKGFSFALDKILTSLGDLLNPFEYALLLELMFYGNWNEGRRTNTQCLKELRNV